MRISHRLYLTVAPAIVGVFLAIGLAYYGQYARSAPEIVVVAGIAAITGSLVLAWRNALYIARRIERLAGSPASASLPSLEGLASAVAPGHAHAAPDEIDEIERVVERLCSAVTNAEIARADGEGGMKRRAHDYALLLLSLADASVRKLEEVRLPLHILLENRFGELNENQEEMLGAARAAAETADADMRHLREIAELELGTIRLRQDSIKPSELVRALRPMLVAAAENAHVALEIGIEPLLPATLGDRARLQDAIVTILRTTIANGVTGAAVNISVANEKEMIRISVTGAQAPRADVTWVAAARLIQSLGGSVEKREGSEVDIVLRAVNRLEILDS